MMQPRRHILTLISAQIVVLLVSAVHSKAQWIVEDPAAIAQDAANQAANLAKYVEMVNNQVAQINTLTQQLNQIAAYTKAFGDPAKLLRVVGADALTRSLNNTGVNRTLGELRELSNGVSALQYNANGLYHTVTDISFSGVTVPRPEEAYRKFGAINETAENYVAVYDDVFARRKGLKRQMAATTNQLQAATTDAETQKLTGVLVGQSAELEAIDRELEIAASQAVVQDIENRNDEARQAQAAAEELAADRHDAMHKMGRMLIPDVESQLLFGKRK